MTVLSSLDWLIRTKAPELLRVDGDDSDASTLESRPAIDRVSRVNTALNVVNNIEANILASWDSAWDASWQEASDGRFADIIDNLPDSLGTMLDGTDAEKGLLKAALRVLAMVRCRRLGRGS